MNLEISLFLLIIFFTAGQSLRCYECTDLGSSCEAHKETTCFDERSSCAILTAMTQIGGNTTKWMIKTCADVCISALTNFGIAWMSSVCCNTELCNFQDAPDPNSLAPNGKKCYYCDEKSCSNILRCTGNAYYCFNGTVHNFVPGDQSMVVKGCVSQSICDAVASNPDVSCCEGNLCNGAKSVTQSFLFLCCSLLSFILLH